MDEASDSAAAGLRPVAFAVPGDLDTRTGGDADDRAVIAALLRAGREVRHIALPAGFPAPTAAEMNAAAQRLRDVPPGTALLIDGLAFGALDPAALAGIAAPICALVHHPLALESGLAPARAAALQRTEAANLAQARHVLVTSAHTATVLARDYGVARARITIALPGVAHPPGPARPSSPPLILSVGSLSQRKGHDVLLAALARIADLDWQAVIAGPARDEALAETLAGQAETAGIAARLRFAGELGEDALAGLYARASVFALATRYEGYGMVFAEALAHGLPIVSCRAGAVPDTVPPGAGRLVAPDDPVAFAAALRAVLTDAGRRKAMREAALVAARALPGWEDTGAIVARALDTL